MELQVRHLRVLCAIARAGSLNRAAVELGMAQPALSHQLRRIEDVVGCALFERDRTGVSPTVVGALVLTRANAIVPAFDELERDFRATAPTNDGPIRIGWNNSAIAAELIGALLSARPTSAITSCADVSRSRLTAQVQRRNLDLALVMMCGVRSLVVPPDLSARVLVREPTFVALPSHHRLAKSAAIDLTDLAEDNWIISSCGDGCRVTFREVCLAHGFAPRIVHDTEAPTQLVAAGHGICLIQPTAPESDGIAIRPLIGTPIVGQHILLWRRDSPLAELISGHLSTVLQASYRAMTERSERYRQWMSGTFDSPRELAG